MAAEAVIGPRSGEQVMAVGLSPTVAQLAVALNDGIEAGSRRVEEHLVTAHALKVAAGNQQVMPVGKGCSMAAAAIGLLQLHRLGRGAKKCPPEKSNEKESQHKKGRFCAQNPQFSPPVYDIWCNSCSIWFNGYGSDL